MAWDGSGTFARVHNWTNDEAADVDILSSRMDSEDDNFSAGIGACLTKNNESKPTADFRPSANRSYALGSTALRWTTGYFGTGFNVQSATAAAATTVSFTDATSARTVTFPDASGTVDFINAPQTISAVKTHSASIWHAEGAAVASAADCNIWSAADGNTVHVTGTTTISDWGTAPQAGAGMWVIFDGALQLTYNATTNKLNTNATNYTTTAGDRAFVYAETTSSYVVTVFPLDGKPLVPYSADLLHVYDEKTATTAGGDFTNGAWRTRTLNTVATNGITGASLATDQITLPAGTFYISARAPARGTSAHKARLYDATGAAVLLTGTSAFSSATTSESFVTGVFTLGASSAIELQHQCNVTVATTGFGPAGGFSTVERYAEVMIWRIA